MAEDVYRLVRELGFGEVSVVGHDLGAMVAYHAYAREHREEVRRMAFMSASLLGFGLEELMDFSEPGQGRYGLAFFIQPELPKTLIEGRERYFLTEFIGSEAVTGTDPRAGLRSCSNRRVGGAGRNCIKGFVRKG